MTPHFPIYMDYGATTPCDLMVSMSYAGRGEYTSLYYELPTPQSPGMARPQYSFD